MKIIDLDPDYVSQAVNINGTLCCPRCHCNMWEGTPSLLSCNRCGFADYRLRVRELRGPPPLPQDASAPSVRPDTPMGLLKSFAGYVREFGSSRMFTETERSLLDRYEVLYRAGQHSEGPAVTSRQEIADRCERLSKMDQRSIPGIYDSASTWSGHGGWCGEATRALKDAASILCTPETRAAIQSLIDPTRREASMFCPRCDNQGYTLERKRNMATLSPSDDTIVEVACTYPECEAAKEWLRDNKSGQEAAGII